MNSDKKFFLSKLHTPVWLFLLISFVIILRIPSFFEPYWNNHEAIYLVVGRTINQGVLLYSEIYVNNPPFIYLVAAISGSLFLLKAVLAVWHIITVYIFWKLSERLFPKKLGLQKISTVLFGLFSTFPLLQGNVASPEFFMLGSTMLAFYLLLDKDLSKNKLLLSGMLFSISTMFSAYGFFDVFVFIFVWLAARPELKEFSKILRRLTVILTGVFTPIFITMIYYWQNNAIQEYVYLAYLQHFTQLFFMFSLIVIAAHLFLFLARRSLSRQFLFLSSWLFITMFSFVVSGQYHNQQLLTVLPPAVLLIGVLFTSKKMDQPLSIIPLSIFFFTPFFFGLAHHSTISYYENFIHLVLGNKTTEEHHNYFGNNVVRNYKMSNYIKNSTEQEDSIYIQGGDKYLVYALSERIMFTRPLPANITPDSHQQDQNDRFNENEYPKMIVLIAPDKNSSQLRNFLNSNYKLSAEIEGAEFWTPLLPDIRSLIAP